MGLRCNIKIIFHKSVTTQGLVSASRGERDRGRNLNPNLNFLSAASGKGSGEGLWLEDFHLELSSRYLKEGSIAVLDLKIIRYSKP